MLGRAQALSAGASRRVVGGTFHSVAHRFVRAHAAALGLSADFGLLDPGDVADVIDLVRSEQGHGSEQGRRFPRKHTLADIYSRTVNAQRPLRDILDEAFPWCDEHVEALSGLFRGYTARKRASACSTSTTSCSTGARWCATTRSAATWPGRSTTSSSTSTRTSTASRSTSSARSRSTAAR